VKFLADMGIFIETVKWLRSLGHEAVHLHEQGLDRTSDAEIVEKARNEGRVLLVHDLGFGQLLALSGATLPSVVTFRLLDMRPESVNRHLEQILRQYQNELVQGVMILVQENRIRVRSLPT
jgi:predicted nuclease of predicted toxin-antitoxin system